MKRIIYYGIEVEEEHYALKAADGSEVLIFNCENSLSGALDWAATTKFNGFLIHPVTGKSKTIKSGQVLKRGRRPKPEPNVILYKMSVFAAGAPADAASGLEAGK